MRQENIIETLDRFFLVSDISTSDVKYDCRREYYELYKAETFEDFKAVVDLVNNRFGKRILTVGLLTWRNGEQTKRVYDSDVFTPCDAAKDESIYCGSNFETNDLHVVRNEYLEGEFEFWEEPIKELEDEDEKAELLASLRHTEYEIREMMADDKVLYYNAQMNLTEDFAWDVLPRYPVAWDYDTENYQMVLLVSDDYEDRDFEDDELSTICDQHRILITHIDDVLITRRIMNMKKYKRLELLAAAFRALGYENAYVVHPQTAHDDDYVSVAIHGARCAIDCKVWCKENGSLPEYTLQMSAGAAPVETFHLYEPIRVIESVCRYMNYLDQQSV